ncbi:hypothetical protein EPUS_04049 [Endocarpon pusillum Z07020]|uniref:Uncharacterized protein n=1 Tax=Endocarpon pusillum (strain Z07020 / HMAS-L-300199) TaxID=1263415 RepID=U1GNB7_ENDPU|nr:uncharacterized protein EPUS_04049 [Endocarpon pusillum Z07020]ERF73426.1 hypothetical protein EPUS_04049 [Endocarpon pusillum Z07020]
MDVAVDTSSVQFGGQWSFLRNQNQTLSTGHVSRRPLHQLVGYRDRLRSSTIPSQPVTVRVNSADASSHLNPAPRTNRMGKRDELPPVSDFTIDGILAAIQPDIEGTLDAIAEIMGRSRLSLANEYDSHMPPQGEIRASSRSALLPVEEASSSNEQLAADNVIIVPEDASLIDGSHAGSAAYGLLERLRAAPRTRRSDLMAPRALSSPAVLEDFEEPISPTTLRSLLNNGGRPTEPTVSETYLSAGANDRLASSPIMVADSEHPLYYDDTNLLQELSIPQSPQQVESAQIRVQNLSLISDLRGLATWLHRDRRACPKIQEDAETRLRMILERNVHKGEADDGMHKP